MKEYIKKFNNYVKKYDLKNKNIMRKYHHSFRVMGFCEEIAKDLNLSEEDIFIAKLCGLYHDIARFEQWTKYNTFKDEKSFDHGDLGYDILNKEKFIDNKEYLDIVLNATRYHNKYKVNDGLSERVKLFCNIVRDADKLDIIKEQGNQIIEDKIVLNKELLNSIYNKEICKNGYISSSSDVILRMLSWVFDLNFKYSYKFIMNNNIIDNKFKLLELYGQTDEINRLKQFIYKNIDERMI